MRVGVRGRRRRVRRRRTSERGDGVEGKGEGERAEGKYNKSSTIAMSGESKPTPAWLREQSRAQPTLFPR